jgi:hypothetical protein
MEINPTDHRCSLIPAAHAHWTEDKGSKFENPRAEIVVIDPEFGPRFLCSEHVGR